MLKNWLRWRRIGGVNSEAIPSLDAWAARIERQRPSLRRVIYVLTLASLAAVVAGVFMLTARFGALILEVS